MNSGGVVQDASERRAQPFDPAQRDLRTNRPAGQFASSAPTGEHRDGRDGARIGAATDSNLRLDDRNGFGATTAQDLARDLARPGAALVGLRGFGARELGEIFQAAGEGFGDVGCDVHVAVFDIGMQDAARRVD